MLTALLLAAPLSAQVVSVKTSVPVFAGAPGVVFFQAPALNTGLSSPALAAGLTPSLSPALAPMPVLAAPAAPLAVRALAAVPVQGAKAISPLRSAVRTFGDGLSAIPSALTGLFDGAAATGEPADPVSAAGVPVRSLAAIKQLKVGSYNVENLYEQVGKHVPDPENPGKLKKISDAKPKPEWALREEGRIILENDLDIVTLAEVEDIQALEDFNQRFLDGKYRTFLIEGNDERGIDIAFLVKKDLPFELEQRSHKDETWLDPVLGGGPKPLFSRDLTSLVVRAPGKSQPLFVLFGTHYKSKRDRDGRDPESVIMRTAQVQRTAEIMARYREEFGADVPMMIAGDFNGAVAEEPAYAPLFGAAGLTDSFDAAPKPPSKEERITHSYHPRDGPARYVQMDAVLVSKSLRGAVQSAEVYRYKNPDGTARLIPKTYEERELNPSDHFPLLVTLDFAPILRAAVAPLPLAVWRREKDGSAILAGPLRGRMIGGGSEGTVFAHPLNPSLVVKVAESQSARGLDRQDEELESLARIGAAPRPLARLDIEGYPASVRERIVGRTLDGGGDAAELELARKLTEDIARAGWVAGDYQPSNIMIGRRNGRGPVRAWMVDPLMSRERPDLSEGERFSAMWDVLMIFLRVHPRG